MLYYFKSNYIGYIFVVYLALCTGEKSKNHSQISCDFNNDLCEYNSNGNFIRYNGTSPGDRLQGTFEDYTCIIGLYLYEFFLLKKRDITLFVIKN